MTKQRTLKHRVRARMAKTGESYTAARRMLIAAGDRPDPVAVPFEPTVSEEKLVEATGRGWQEWLGILDAWGAAGRRHNEIVRWLAAEHAVPDWYTQAITVTYERARGIRVVGQRADGSFVASATKTIAVPVERLFEAFQDEELRERWLPRAELRLRAATAPRTARYDWEDGESRLVVAFVEMSDAKSQVAVEHERLPDADTVGEMKSWWRARLDELKSLLEGGRTR
jgi:hypothetical protein